ncbi:carbonic anhydrase [Cellulomonas endophytica]|uniref:carbonic anhydrase n=1 Tax=Cellulomonas endophytica TaxID=2494735 RepID=UPI00101153E0|nr:carbonic anhydrase family protein [Cellulomonas endophytica]
MSRTTPAMRRPRPTALLLPTAATLLLVAACAGPAATPTSTDDPSASPSEHGGTTTVAHWAYTGEEGADRWAELSEDYSACGTGARQSPVDLPSELPEPTVDVVLDDGTVEGRVSDTGHVLQFDTTDSGDEHVLLGDRDLSLVQFHAHTPAEHSIAGERVDAEVHLVHADDEGLLVLGVPVRAGAENAVWVEFLAAAEGGDALTLDVADLLPSTGRAYLYEGSLTTPPCSETVQWVVLADAVEMSPAQVAALSEAHGDNARPVQPLAGRTVGGGALVLDEG